MRLLVSICILIFFSIDVIAQSFSLKHFTAEDGINSSTVYWASQGPKGYLWFGTSEGICKFDGKNFIRYTTDDGLSDNEVFVLKTDSKGRVWVLTFNGHLSYYDNAGFHNESNTPWLKKTFVGASYVSFFESSDGKLFFGSLGDKIILITNDSIVKILATQQSLNGYSFFEKSDKTILIYCPATCLVFRDNFIDSMRLQHTCTRAYFTQLSQKKYQLYLSEDGLIKKSGNKEKILIPIRELFPSISITGVTEYPDSSYLITSRNGALWFTNGVFKKSEAIQLLTGKTILSAFADNENNFWFCTEGDGVYMLPANHKKFLNFTSADGLKSEKINRVVKDAHNNIWLACENSVVSEISNKEVKNYVLNELVYGNGRVLDIAVDRNDDIYAATDAGVIRLFQNNKQIFIPYKYQGNYLNSYSAKGININNDKSITTTLLWGVLKMENEKNSEKILSPLNDSIPRIRTYSHFIDKEQRLWIANINGLNLWEKDHLKCYSSVNSVLEKRIVNMTESQDSTLLLATESYGVIFFKNEKIINHFTRLNGLSSNVCRRLFIKGNKVWVSTNQGLTSFTYNNNLIKDISIYNVNNGLPSNSIKDVYADSNKIYVATEKGLCIMQDLDIQNQSQPPVIYITEISNTNHNFKFINDTYIFYNNNQVKINFTAISFQNPAELRYRYRIAYSKSEWIETTNNSIEYSGMAPGYYKFEVQAKKFDSGWSDTAAISFSIIPPFYKRLWFLSTVTACIIILIAFIVWYFVRLRFNKKLKVVKQKELLEQERIRIATDMHDDLGSELTKISIISEVIKNDTEAQSPAIKNNLEKIIFYATDLRKKMDEIIWALNPKYDSVGNLLAFIHEYAEEFFDDTVIKCHVKISSHITERNISANIKRNIFLVIKEALNNIYRHSSATKVEMELAYADKQIVIKIVDNGKGFDGLKQHTQGNGLKNMRKRIKDILGTLLIESNPDKGCVLVIHCPI